MNRSFFDMLGDPLPTPHDMAAWDAATVQRYLPEYELIKNAGREAFSNLQDQIEPQSNIFIIMGGGNNGADGAALASLLHQAGHCVTAFTAKPLGELSGETRKLAEEALEAGVGIVEAEPGTFHSAVAEKPNKGSVVIVDALMGTGGKGPIRDREVALIRSINSFKGEHTIVSLDVPSGLNAVSGLPCPEAVMADFTVTFEALKPGMVYSHARKYTGPVSVRPVGIPSNVKQDLPTAFRLLKPRSKAWPTIAPEMHKGMAGRVLIFGGSPGFAGAPVLAALGALRSGSGLVTIACPQTIEPLVRSGFPEIMTLPLGRSHQWTYDVLPLCIKAVRGMAPGTCLVIGPGMGKDNHAAKIVTALIGEEQRPSIVLDADALAVLESSHNLKLLREDDCITPHPGEAAHILGITADAVQADRIGAFRALTAGTKAMVILKGANTLLGNAKSPAFVAPFASPSLGVGGSGDILSGIIASFIALFRGTPISVKEGTFRAAALGVYAHGKSGEMLDVMYPNRGALAREIADMLPHVPRQ